MNKVCNIASFSVPSTQEVLRFEKMSSVSVVRPSDFLLRLRPYTLFSRRQSRLWTVKSNIEEDETSMVHETISLHDGYAVTALIKRYSH